MKEKEDNSKDFDSEEIKEFRRAGVEFVKRLSVVENKFGVSTSASMWLTFLGAFMAAYPPKLREFFIMNTQNFLRHYPLQEFKNEEEMDKALRRLTEDFKNG